MARRRVEDVAMGELRVVRRRGRGWAMLEEVRTRIRMLLSSAGDYATGR